MGPYGLLYLHILVSELEFQNGCFPASRSRKLWKAARWRLGEGHARLLHDLQLHRHRGTTSPSWSLGMKGLLWLNEESSWDEGSFGDEGLESVAKAAMWDLGPYCRSAYSSCMVAFIKASFRIQVLWFCVATASTRLSCDGHNRDKQYITAPISLMSRCTASLVLLQSALQPFWKWAARSCHLPASMYVGI